MAQYYAQTNKYLDIVKEITLDILPTNAEVFLFGSIVSGHFTRSSDIDIGIRSDTQIDSKIINSLKEAIEESIVPYNIDIVDFSKTSDCFNQIALKEVIKWR